VQVDDDAPCDEIKRAYRAMAKECHPDYMGDVGHDICILLNEAYETLMDEGARAAYNAQLETALADEDDGYTGGCICRRCWLVRERTGFLGVMSSCLGTANTSITSSPALAMSRVKV
jgi:DnaJ-class molecular chaperone